MSSLKTANAINFIKSEERQYSQIINIYTTVGCSISSQYTWFEGQKLFLFFITYTRGFAGRLQTSD